MVTLGSAGALVVWDERSGEERPGPGSIHAVLVPGIALPASLVVDTTGAGDAFAGGSALAFIFRRDVSRCNTHTGTDAGATATFYSMLRPSTVTSSGALALPADVIDTAILVESVRRAVYVATQVSVV